MRTSDHLQVGTTSSRERLREQFQIGDATINTGVFRPAGHDSVWLFITENKTSDRTPYVDHLVGDDLRFEGQSAGLRGRKAPVSRLAAKEPGKVVLFPARGSPEPHGLGERTACKSAAIADQMAARWGSVDEAYMAALNRWVKDGGQNSAHLQGLLASWKANDAGRKAVIARQFASRARATKGLLHAVEGPLKVAGRVSGAITSIQLLNEVFKELKEECKSKCCAPAASPGNQRQSGR